MGTKNQEKNSEEIEPNWNERKKERKNPDEREKRRKKMNQEREKREQ